MIVAERIAQLRERLEELGERPSAETLANADAGKFNDFDQFSERNSPGDKGPSFGKFANAVP